MSLFEIGKLAAVLSLSELGRHGYVRRYLPDLIPSPTKKKLKARAKSKAQRKARSQTRRFA